MTVLAGTEVRLARVSGGGDYWTLTITDQEHSGRKLIEVRLDDEQFSNLLSSRSARGDAEILPEQFYPEVGKQYVHHAVPLPADIVRYRPKGPGYNKPDSVLLAWSERYRDNHPEWTYERWTLHNYGWCLMVSRYE